MSGLRRRDAPPLYDRDGSHPTLAGSYLAACVIYLVLADTSAIPLGLEGPGLDANHARLLRQAAENAARRAAGGPRS